MNWREFQEYVEERVAEPDTPEGQEQIHADGETHVSEVWEDGEVTITKCGDLYSHRNLHQVLPPRLPEGMELWPTGDSEHQRMVVIDDEVVEFLKEATFKWRGERYFEVERE